MSHHCSSLQAAPVLLQRMTDGCLLRDASAQVHRLPEPANQPRASSQLNALSRSVALATAISAPPSTTHIAESDKYGEHLKTATLIPHSLSSLCPSMQGFFISFLALSARLFC